MGKPNPVLAIVRDVVAEHSNVLPTVFSISLPKEQWEEMWRHPIPGPNGKPVAQCARLRFMPGGFHVIISESDTGDPPQDEVH